MRSSPAVLAALILVSVVAELPAAEPPPGRKMIDAYFRRQVKDISDACLGDVKTREDWEKKRPELRRQFLEMIGLDPLPPRTDLHATITGTIDADKFTIEKLHYQSVPGLYVTANLYVPKNAKLPAPAILYLCGHGSSIRDKVSSGNKVVYQHHGAWFAEHGYVCLIIDTLQLGEIQGIHHGTHPGKKHNMWWWHTVGYTPAGIECWNAMRALDYLETRKEVDPKRIGVTGRSGGGAYSWWLAAADDRPQCFVPVAGIVDLQAHVVEGVAPRFHDGVIAGHCDCMYFNNLYRWDFATVAALCAPRPLALGNSDADEIFPLPGYRRLADKVRRIYELYGASHRFELLETAGPHKDTPELRKGAYRWLNRWLKNDHTEVTESAYTPLPPEKLKVFERIPDDACNTTIHETFRKPAHLVLPEAPAVAQAWWVGRSVEIRQALRDKVFRNWPAAPPPLALKQVSDLHNHGLRLRSFVFTSEQDIDLRIWLLTADKVKPNLVMLTAFDEAGFRAWVDQMAGAFREPLKLPGDTEFDAARFEETKKALTLHGWALAGVTARGIGPTRWADSGSADEANIRRRFVLIGQTLDGQRVWDVRRALAALREVPELQGVPRSLHGTGDMAGIALYAGLFEPDVKRFDLVDLPASQRQGPIFLNVRRYLDLPEAVALAFPAEIRITVKDRAATTALRWTEKLGQALQKDSLKIRLRTD
jgi:hypothetical protein